MPSTYSSLCWGILLSKVYLGSFSQGHELRVTVASVRVTLLPKGRYTRGSLLLQHAPATPRSRSKAPSSAPTISSEKNMLRNKTFAPEFCSLISNWFDMREQAPGANLLDESVSGASSLVCTKN